MHSCLSLNTDLCRPAKGGLKALPTLPVVMSRGAIDQLQPAEEGSRLSLLARVHLAQV